MASFTLVALEVLTLHINFLYMLGQVQQILKVVIPVGKSFFLVCSQNFTARVSSLSIQLSNELP